MDHEKLMAMVQWPRPQAVKAIWGFLGSLVITTNSFKVMASLQVPLHSC
jgi:hypothetical protein